MEPTSFNVGDNLRHLRVRNTGPASMEPTSFNVGDGKIPLPTLSDRSASMEPTSFNVGDLAAAEKRECTQ